MIDFFSWRAAFLIPGAGAVLVGLVLLASWRRGLVVDARADRSPTPARDPGDVYRVFIVLTFTMACAGFVYAGVTNTMPKLFEMGLGEHLATGYTKIGLFVGVISGLASASGILGGWLADRFSARSIYLVFWMLQAPVLFVITSTTGLPAADRRAAGAELQPVLRRRGEHARRAIHAGALALRSSPTARSSCWRSALPA